MILIVNLMIYIQIVSHFKFQIEIKKCFDQIRRAVFEPFTLMATIELHNILVSDHLNPSMISSWSPLISIYYFTITQIPFITLVILSLVLIGQSTLYHTFYPYYFPYFGGYGFGYGFRAFSGK